MTVTNYPPLSGGLGVYVRNLAQQISEKGHQVTVLTMQGRHNQERTQGGVRVVSLPRQVTYRGVFTLPLSKESYRVIDREIAETDVVNAHTRYFPLTFISVKKAAAAGVPVFVTEHGGGFVSAASPLTLGGARLADLTTGRWSLRNANGVLAVSEKSASFVKRLSGKDAVIVGNGLDLSFWNRRLAVGASESVVPTGQIKNVLFVGRLVSEKGWRLLLGAWQELPHSLKDGYRLIFVGEGPDLAKLRRQIAQYRLTDVVALGQRSSTVVRDLMCGGFLANPSRAAEGFQTTLLEARAVSTYVITSPVGGATETVADQQVGQVVASYKLEAWVDALMVGFDKAGVAVGRGDVDRYGWPEVTDRYLRAISSFSETNLTS